MAGFNFPMIVGLKVKNFRVLKNFELKNLTPLTVFVGPNGCGKSTVLDVLAFLSECFQYGLKIAWEKRGGYFGIYTRGADNTNPIVIELKYRERKSGPVITYHLGIAEDIHGSPVVVEEWLQWKTKETGGKPLKFLEFSNGSGSVILGENPNIKSKRICETLSSSDMLAAATMGNFTKYPRVNALKQYIIEWHLSSFSVTETKHHLFSGSQERLSVNGDNLANVIQYLLEYNPEIMKKIQNKLSERVPRFQSVCSKTMGDGRLGLMIQDSRFPDPISSEYVSDGTLRLLAYYVLLYSQSLPQLVGIEEPENQLHPTLLQSLAEDFKIASGKTQLFVTTHSPYFVDEFNPKNVWVIYRDFDGYSKPLRVSDMEDVVAFLNIGDKIGMLWMQGTFDAGYPFVNSGVPRKPLIQTQFPESENGVY